MSKLKAYSGGCHCGRVRYETTTDPSQAIACNCSICAKHGLWLTFVTPQQFKLVSGLDDLADHQFNKHVIHHVFCRTVRGGIVRARQDEGRQGHVRHQCALPRRRRHRQARVPSRSTAAACDRLPRTAAPAA